MVAYSKLFKEAVMANNCQYFHHGSCVGNAIKDLYLYAFAGFRFYAPIVLIPLLFKLRQLNPTILKNALKYFINCIWVGVMTGYSITVLLCGFYHLLGGFKLWTFTYLPSLLGGLTLLVAPTRVQALYQVSMMQGAIEAELCRRGNVITKLIGNSLTLQTWIFMCSSAIILHAKSTGVFRGFWLISPAPLQPAQKPEENDVDTTTTNAISTQRNDIKYLLVGIRNSFAFGLALDVIKVLKSKTSKGPGLLGKLRNLSFSSAALFSSHAAIYRFFELYGKHWILPQSKWNAWLPGFFAGLSYLVLPKLTLLAYGITQALRILWQYYENQPLTPVPENENTRMRNVLYKLQHVFKYRLPYGTIIYSFCMAYLIHNVCMARPHVGKFSENIIYGLTNNYAYQIKMKVSATERLMKAAAEAAKQATT